MNPLSESLLYEVTDVHVPGHADRIGQGIDEEDLCRWMPKMNLLAIHTYRFHGFDLCAVEQNAEKKGDGLVVGKRSPRHSNGFGLQKVPEQIA